MENKEIDLAELIPGPSSFKLIQFDEFEFRLKPCTSGRLIEMTDRLGNIEKILALPTAENVSKIAMMLMEIDSAQKFKKQKVKIIDVMSGDEIEAEIGGYKLMMECISGIKEQYSIYGAILRSLGYTKKDSEKIVKKMTDGINKVVNDELKKVNPVKKKKTKKR